MLSVEHLVCVPKTVLVLPGEQSLDFEEFFIIGVVPFLDLRTQRWVYDQGRVKYCVRHLPSLNDRCVEICEVAFCGLAHAGVHSMNIDCLCVRRTADLHLDLLIVVDQEGRG